ncbi:DUF2244 domain-containing protein [Rhizobium sp. NRK18]|uniref:DUF2244 domain-containing protein n=1 Tax=Rhizobium sp. NRK18 TaxID=2964667 RepID=UPI0021C29927|nr:DUF2244 domain-containing protein [Rhizobium sp. NRK18]MCQ2002667.1 DUF2244 domain-containing protein [Rhizobium sp. NRK18]
MESNAENVNEQPVFAAVLMPYRSLGGKGFRVLLTLTFAMLALQAALFMTTGAWPVVMFCGLDFLLLYGAFWLSYRSGRAREEVSVSHTDLSIRKFSPSGRIRAQYRFNPFWAKFRVHRHEEFGILSMHVSGEGRATDIGSCLNPEDRESFAKAFKGALATVKRRL